MTYTTSKLCIQAVLSITALLSLLPLATDAQTYDAPTYREPSGRTWTCYAPHGYTWEIVPVLGQNGYVGGFWGFASYTNTGWPVITFDAQQLRQYPLILARFVYYHECAHLSIPTLDEIEANCEALINMRQNNDISPDEENILRDVYYSLPPFLLRDGRNGRALWDATIACAGYP